MVSLRSRCYFLTIKQTPEQVNLYSKYVHQVKIHIFEISVKNVQLHLIKIGEEQKSAPISMYLMQRLHTL